MIDRIHFAVLPVLLIMTPFTTAPDAARKCGGTASGADPIYMVDGIITATESPSRLDGMVPDDVLYIQIVCMNPRDSTLNRTNGIPVVSVWTRGGPITRARELLATLADAQATRFRDAGSFATDLSDIAVPEPPAGIRLTLEMNDEGWVGRASIERFLGSCVVYGGTTDPATPGLEPSTPACPAST